MLFPIPQKKKKKKKKKKKRERETQTERESKREGEGEHREFPPNRTVRNSGDGLRARGLHPRRRESEE